MQGQCECEHISHEASCRKVGVYPIPTIFGTLTVCPPCNNDHPYPADMRTDGS